MERGITKTEAVALLTSNRRRRRRHGITARRPRGIRVRLAGIMSIRTTDEGWLYLVAAPDFHSRAGLILAALTMDIQRQRPAPGLVHHSDAAATHRTHILLPPHRDQI